MMKWNIFVLKKTIHLLHLMCISVCLYECLCIVSMQYTQGPVEGSILPETEISEAY